MQNTETIAADRPVAPANSERRLVEPAPSLGRHDWLILPLLSLLTIVVLFGVAEASTRALWSSEDRGYCMRFDPVEGPHGKANCTNLVKIPEGEAVALRFNACGYREPSVCGPKQPKSIRVALLGSSIAQGYPIPDEDTLGSRMVDEMHRKTGAHVEIANLGAEACPPIYSYRHMDEALRLQPDVIVMPVNPWDLEQDIDPDLLAMRADPRPLNRAPAPMINLTSLQKLQAAVKDSRTMLVAQHFMLQNRDTFLKLYLFAGGDHTAFVRYPFTPAWERRLANTDLLIGEMAAKAHAAGVAFAVIGIPERAQVVMLRVPNLPHGVEPGAFTARIGQIAKEHGVLYIDGLKVLAKSPDPDKLFYIVDGHPTPLAHEMIGDATGALLSQSLGAAVR